MSINPFIPVGTNWSEFRRTHLAPRRMHQFPGVFLAISFSGRVLASLVETSSRSTRNISVPPESLTGGHVCRVRKIIIYNCLHQCIRMSEPSLKIHALSAASPSTVPSTLHSVWVRPQRGRKTTLQASQILELLDLLFDAEGYWWEVVWAPLRPDAGQYQPQVVRRTKITPPLERGWYPTRSSCLVRCNTVPWVSTFRPRICAWGIYLQYFIKLGQWHIPN